MRKFLAGITALGLITSMTGMTAMAATSKTAPVAAKTTKAATPVAKTTTVVEHATLVPVGKSKVRGTATLTLDEKTHVLTVVVGASGMVPKSSHPEHIHKGAKGPVVYPLNTLVANAKGIGSVTTTIKNVKSIASGWVINIHQGPAMTGSGANVIAQGAVH